MIPNQQAHRYREIAVKTANPLQLVVILYDGAIYALQEAQEHLKRKNIAGRARALNRSLAFISELHGCLNFQEGGAIADSLARLYQYMKRLIVKANLDQRPEPLAEVVSLLEDLRSAWSELATQSQKIDVSSERPRVPETTALRNGTTGVSSLNICG